MVQGMSRDAWEEFSKIILVRYVLSYLCGTLYLDPSASLKKVICILCGGSFQPFNPCLNLTHRLPIFFFADGFETSQLRYRRIHVHMLNKAYEMSDFVIINQSTTIGTTKYFLGMTQSHVIIVWLDYEQSPIFPQGQQSERNARGRENYPTREKARALAFRSLYYP